MAYSDCVHCGLCLNACPTYLELGTETDSPRGRIYLMEHLAAGALPLESDVVRHLDLCLGCRACESACPSGVQYGRLIEQARIRLADEYPRSPMQRWKRRLIAALFPYPQRLRLILWPARVLERVGLLDGLRRWSPTIAMLPALDRAPGPDLLEKPVGGGSAAGAALFRGCVAQVLFPETQVATRRVLRRRGFDTAEPAGQGCCGALSLHAGDVETARAFARRNIEAFPGDEPIVVDAAGCGAMLKEYGELLRDDPDWAPSAESFSRRVRDVTEVVSTPAAVSHVSAGGAAETRPLRVTYHDACHLAHAQGIRREPRELLRSIPGVELVELAESEICCGSAGSYNLTEPEMAQRLGQRKAERIRATGASCVAVANPGCAMQIRAALRRIGAGDIEVVHPVELVDRMDRRGQ